MRAWRSLRYRIALIIFLLEAVMMAFVLWGTLGFSLEASRTQLASNEQAMLDVISGMGRIALLTEEYADLQPYIEGVLKDPHIVRVVLTDAEGRVVASTLQGDVGTDGRVSGEMPGTLGAAENFWRSGEITNAGGRLGVLAIEFTNKALLDTIARARTVGLTIAAIGMSIIAIAGVLTGVFLTRRLDRLTAAARGISKGDLDVTIDVAGTDEIGELARSFETMVGNLREGRRNLRDQAERFKLLLDSAGEAIFGLDRDGNCSFCNAACVDLLGYERAEQLLGQNMQRLILNGHAETPSDAEEGDVFSKAYTFGQDSHIRDVLLVRADGSDILADGRAKPIYQGGALVGAVVNFADVTEARKSEDALRRAQRMQSVTQLTGGIAHDFNNILGIAVGNLELVEDIAGGNPEMVGLLERVRRALQRGADLTKRLLLFSMQTSQASSPIDLNKVIRGMDDLIAKSLTPQIAVKIALADDLWLAVADPGEFEDVLINLALNARDAMDGAGKLVIATENRNVDAGILAQHPEARPGDHVVVTVSDSGNGIPENILDKIFEPFFTTKDQGKGTGLGLSMVYSFVKRQGGFIDVDSLPDVGTSFYLYLPRSQGTASRTDLEAPGLDEIPGGSETILVVDDEEDLLDFATRFLTRKGYQILAAKDVAEALEYLETDDAIDLLFSDVVMPGGQSGLDLAVRARVLRPELKILLTSGFAEKIQAPAHHQDLLQGVLSKPYRGAELARRVRAALNGRHTKGHQ